MKSRANKVDPYPVMPQGETEFEEKRIACEFELTFKAVAELGLSSIKETHEYAFRAGYIAGKSRRTFEQGNGSPKLPSYIKIL